MQLFSIPPFSKLKKVEETFSMYPKSDIEQLIYRFTNQKKLFGGYWHVTFCILNVLLKSLK